jgi:chromosome partitioning protein
MYDGRNNLSKNVAEDVRTNLGDLVFDSIIPRNVRLSEAPSYALPAILYDHSCVGSQAYIRLAGEVLRRKTQTDARVLEVS